MARWALDRMTSPGPSLQLIVNQSKPLLTSPNERGLIDTTDLKSRVLIRATQASGPGFSDQHPSYAKGQLQSFEICRSEILPSTHGANLCGAFFHQKKVREQDGHAPIFVRVGQLAAF